MSYRLPGYPVDMFQFFCRVVFLSVVVALVAVCRLSQPSNSGVHGKRQAARDQQMGREEGRPVSEDAQWV